jgi:hypothetical protein
MFLGQKHPNDIITCGVVNGKEWPNLTFDQESESNGHTLYKIWN